jgi:hypothetical protein
LVDLRQAVVIGRAFQERSKKGIDSRLLLVYERNNRFSFSLKHYLFNDIINGLPAFFCGQSLRNTLEVIAMGMAFLVAVMNYNQKKALF